MAHRDMMRWGLAALTRSMAAHASRDVTYVRGVDEAVVRATFGSKLLRIQDADGGTRIEHTDLDFLIPAADLILDGTAITPERGDRIVVAEGEGDAAESETYEVLPYGDEPCWRWADPHRSAVRVHTKHVDTEPYS